MAWKEDYNQGMLNQNILGVALWAPLILMTACSTPKSSTASERGESSPLRLLIGDGGVRLEESYSHGPEGDKGRATAAFLSEHGRFTPSERNLAGQAWIEPSSEYMLERSSRVGCRVKIGREELSRAPTARHESYTYFVDVSVTDGIQGGPFETLINGENEGLIQLGEFPVNTWQSTENLVVNDTVVESWFYEADKKRYEIVKKMGGDLFLKKSLRFDPYLRGVTFVRYEILRGQEEEVDQQRSVLARLTCKS